MPVPHCFTCGGPTLADDRMSVLEALFVAGEPYRNLAYRLAIQWEMVVDPTRMTLRRTA